MASQFQPITLQVTSSLRRLRSQLLAAWPPAPNTSQRLRAVKTITTHIKDSLPADYQGDVSVFLSNEAETIANPITQGFLYHLTQQQIVTRQIAKKNNNLALVQIQVTTAEQFEEPDETQDAEQTPPVSRIEQIKQWQKETVKAMFQAMADTAITMEAQTSLRGAMAGLNKLAALLNKATAAVKQAQSPVKGAVQKTAMRDIASTLSDLRSTLSAASHNGSLKPPTKSQMALRQQLNKLDKIAPARTSVKPVVVKAPKANVAQGTPKQAAVTSTTLKATASKALPVTPKVRPATAQASRLSARAIPAQTSLPAPSRQLARITIKPLALKLITKPATAPISSIKINIPRVTPRLVSIPVCFIARIPLRTSPIPVQKFSSVTTKAIIQKLADKPVVKSSPLIAIQQVATQTRSTPRFQISRPLIAQLRVTPSVIAAYQLSVAKTASPQTTTKADIAKPDTTAQTQQAKAAQPTSLQTKAPATSRLAVQSLGSKIPLRTTRAPAVYAGLSLPTPILRQAPLVFTQRITTATPAPAIFTARTIPTAPVVAAAPVSNPYIPAPPATKPATSPVNGNIVGIDTGTPLTTVHGSPAPTNTQPTNPQPANPQIGQEPRNAEPTPPPSSVGKETLPTGDRQKEPRNPIGAGLDTSGVAPNIVNPLPTNPTNINRDRPIAQTISTTGAPTVIKAAVIEGKATEGTAAPANPVDASKNKPTNPAPITTPEAVRLQKLDVSRTEPTNNNPALPPQPPQPPQPPAIPKEAAHPSNVVPFKPKDPERMPPPPFRNDDFKERSHNPKDDNVIHIADTVLPRDRLRNLDRTGTLKEQFQNDIYGLRAASGGNNFYVEFMRVDSSDNNSRSAPTSGSYPRHITASPDRPEEQNPGLSLLGKVLDKNQCG